jgi:hypothetical protein
VLKKYTLPCHGCCECKLWNNKWLKTDFCYIDKKEDH